MTKLARIAALLSGSVLVAAACSAEKALDHAAGPDGGTILDALADTLAPGDALADVATPGTRLRPRRVTFRGVDGSVVETWAGTWTDTDRKEICDAVYLAADGKRRCIPVARAEALLGYYTDAKCLAPAFVRPAAAVGAKYLLFPDPSGGERWQVFSVGGPSGDAVYHKEGSTCLGPGPLSALVGVAVKPGPQVEPLAFVEVERTESD